MRLRRVYSTRCPLAQHGPGLLLEERSGDWNFQMTKELRAVSLGYLQTRWRWEEHATKSKSRLPSPGSSSIVPGRGVEQLTDNKRQHHSNSTYLPVKTENTKQKRKSRYLPNNGCALGIQTLDPRVKVMCVTLPSTPTSPHPAGLILT